MKRTSVCIAVGLLVAGCAGQAARPPATEVTRIPEGGGWFCQLSPSGEGWECIQDPELAEDPVPERLPDPRAPPPVSAEAPLPPESQPDRIPGPASGAEAMEPPDADPPAPETPPRPVEPVPLMQLPQDHYAVQLMAMASRQELEGFVQRHDLDGLPSARVERDGSLYYVLLLGVYESLDAARRAVADLPAPLAGSDPWVRPLGSLQSAMARAEALAGSGGI